MDNPFDRFTLADLVGRQSLKWQAYPPDVLPLWVAEMDTDLAEPVRDAIVTAVRRGEVGYPWGRAYPQALASFAADAWDWSLDPDTVRHTADVMTGLAHVVRLVTPADGVLVLTTPVYPPFLDLPEITSRAVRHVRLAETGRLDLEALATAFAAIRAEGRSPTLVLCSPYNPTGVAHTRSELERLAGLTDELGVRVVVDEVHAPLVYPGATFTPYLTVPGTHRAYAVHSASKAFNLPGVKAALIVPGAAAVDEVNAGLPATLDHSASSIGVLAHAVALTEGRDWLAAHLSGLTENRARLGVLLAAELPAIRWQPPEATYLAWLNCRNLGLGDDPAEVLLTRGRVAVNSGSDFGPGGEGHVRLNFATAPQVLTEAVARIRGAAVRSA
ncbi:MAG TPA: aminotransferase class I/II-fold pyridoxal phosphate-dependent enzyme [Microlunatus sp.]